MDNKQEIANEITRYFCFLKTVSMLSQMVAKVLAIPQALL